VIPSISLMPDIAELAPRPDAWGRVTTAAFLTVTELQEAEAADESFGSRLNDAERARLDEMAEQGYRDGHDEGHSKGYAEGYAAGTEQALHAITTRTAAALAALDDAARRLVTIDAVTLAELDQQVAGFAVDVAEVVIGRQPSTGADALARAISFAPDRGNIVARLNPADLAALDDADVLVPGREVTVVADANVQPGGCILDVGACRIDAQIGAALDRVRGILGAEDAR
jgi:flagellar assembly protein FliH